MNIINLVSDTLSKFKVKSLTKPISFYWSGKYMTLYQGGSTFVINHMFRTTFMPPKPCKGLILPEEIKIYIEAQQYLQDHPEEVTVCPVEWGYDIYNTNINNPRPQLVYEVRFYSIKGKLSLMMARLNPNLRVALKNAIGPKSEN